MELVSSNKFGKEVTTSLLVAKVFEKYHKHVLRDIETLSCSDEFNRTNFGPIEYKDKMGRVHKAYEMTKDGFSFLVMGYTGEKAGQFKEMFIKEFNKREDLLKSDEYILQRSQEILNRRVMLLEQRMKEKDILLEASNEAMKEKDAKIAQDAPKVLFADAVTGSKSTCLIGELAKLITQNGYTIGQNRLFKWMRENGYLGTKGEYYNIPNQQYMEMGLFDVKRTVHDENGVMVTKATTKVTGKGQQYFLNKFLSKHATSKQAVPA